MRPRHVKSTTLCACGCGQFTNVIPANNAPMGYVAGQPFRYVNAHNGRIHRRSYVRVRVNGESRQEHQVVAERVLGRPLPRTAEVHHVDGNPRNNAPSNLVICQDGHYHKLLHARARVVKAGGNPNTDRYCGDCRQCRPFTAFNRKTAHPGGAGYQPVCRECQSVRFKKWQAARDAAKGRAA